MLPFTHSVESNHNVLTVRIDISKLKNKEQWFLLRSDAHWDNPDSKQDLIRNHLDEALKRNAGILDFGDFFCAMQGKYDKRSDKSKVRPEHQDGDYLDKLVKTAAQWHSKYNDNWIFQLTGNHETAILKHHETSLLERWSEAMSWASGNVGHKIPILGYSGWCRFIFMERNKTISCIHLWGIHGYGGGGPVTKDMIQRQRQLAYIENADIMVSGHTHDSFVTKDSRVKLSQKGFVEHKQTYYVKLPSYKDEYKTGKGGWHIETGKPPKPNGAMWLRFFPVSKKRNSNDKKFDKAIDFEFIEAK